MRLLQEQVQPEPERPARGSRRSSEARGNKQYAWQRKDRIWNVQTEGGRLRCRRNAPARKPGMPCKPRKTGILIGNTGKPSREHGKHALFTRREGIEMLKETITTKTEKCFWDCPHCAKYQKTCSGVKGGFVYPDTKSNPCFTREASPALGRREGR